jgi:hypothetical protein
MDVRNANRKSGFAISWLLTSASGARLFQPCRTRAARNRHSPTGHAVKRTPSRKRVCARPELTVRRAGDARRRIRIFEYDASGGIPVLGGRRKSSETFEFSALLSWPQARQDHRQDFIDQFQSERTIADHQP